MKFINQCPTGKNNVFYDSPSCKTWMKSLLVEVFNQDDSITELIRVSRWGYTFNDKGEVVYKPSDGDRLKYKVRISVEWDRYGDGRRPRSKVYSLENLADGGQSITFTPKQIHKSLWDEEPELDIKVAMDPSPAPNSLMVTNGTLYVVNQAGNLLMYRHNANGEFENYNGQTIGSGWGGLKHICPVRDGHIYAISANDELLYYHHDANGNFDISGKKIDPPYGLSFPQWVGAGRFGQLYGVNTNGDLLYYHHLTAVIDSEVLFSRWDGRFVGWEANSGKVIGNDWGGFSKLFTGGTNCLYGVATNGDLLYYYHNDDLTWVHSGLVIGNGWGGFTSLSSSGNGEIYAVNAKGELLFYRHDMNKNWISGSPRVIGWGWGGFSAHGVLASAR